MYANVRKIIIFSLRQKERYIFLAIYNYPVDFLLDYTQIILEI